MKRRVPQLQRIPMRIKIEGNKAKHCHQKRTHIGNGNKARNKEDYKQVATTHRAVVKEAEAQNKLRLANDEWKGITKKLFNVYSKKRIRTADFQGSRQNAKKES